jgi:hypothetical protein
MMKPPIKKPFVTWVGGRREHMRSSNKLIRHSHGMRKNAKHTMHQAIKARRKRAGRTPELCDASMAQVATSGVGMAQR